MALSDITSVLSLQARARRNAREQLALVRQLRRDRAAAERELLALEQPGGQDAPLTAPDGSRRI